MKKKKMSISIMFGLQKSCRKCQDMMSLFFKPEDMQCGSYKGVWRCLCGYEKPFEKSGDKIIVIFETKRWGVHRFPLEVVAHSKGVLYPPEARQQWLLEQKMEKERKKFLKEETECTENPNGEIDSS